MKNKRFLLYSVLIALIAGSLLGRYGVVALYGAPQLVNEPLHSTIEALGALAAVAMAMLLLQRREEEWADRSFPLAMGFLGMGLLDGFHGLAATGHGFVLLHAMGSLTGSMWFALIWLPPVLLAGLAATKKWMPWLVAGISAGIWLWTLLAPETLPVLLVDQQFATVTVVINGLAALLFVAAIGRFLVDFNRTGDTETYLLIIMAALFSLTELAFLYRTPWAPEWWLWHILRLSAFLLVMGFVFADYQRKSSHLRELNRHLERRTNELAAINREIEAFSYSISHDLRAPLRSVDGFSHVLLRKYADQLDAEGQDYLRRMRAASQRMGQLIDDMLKLSRVTRGEMQVEKVDLGAIADSVASELRQLEPERTVKFVIAKGAKTDGDPRMLKLALDNLLGNAWKFTANRPSARIEFGAQELDGEKAFFVRDNGAGFDMGYADKLFGAFQRLHSEAEFPGSGIGLAIVQRIVHRHGGRVWAESEVDKGATFYFTLFSVEPGKGGNIGDTGHLAGGGQSR